MAQEQAVCPRPGFRHPLVPEATRWRKTPMSTVVVARKADGVAAGSSSREMRGCCHGESASSV
jgi:hypothetical protein